MWFVCVLLRTYWFIARIKSKIGQKCHQVLYSYIGFAKEKKKKRESTMSDTRELAIESRGCARVELVPTAQGGLALEIGYCKKHTRQNIFFFFL